MHALVFERSVGPEILAIREISSSLAGGDPAPADPRVLMDGSRSLTGGELKDVLRTVHDRRTRAADLFDPGRRGDLCVAIESHYPLADGAQADARLERRRALGKVLLIP